MLFTFCHISLIVFTVALKPITLSLNTKGAAIGHAHLQYTFMEQIKPDSWNQSVPEIVEASKPVYFLT
jgi:hypothetical protein